MKNGGGAGAGPRGWGCCGDADACVVYFFDLLTRAAVKKTEKLKI